MRDEPNKQDDLLRRVGARVALGVLALLAVVTSWGVPGQTWLAHLIGN